MNYSACQYVDLFAPAALREPASVAFTRVLREATVVECHGEIDIVTAVEVRRHLDVASARAHARLVVDLRPTDFFDCSAVGELCRAHRRCRERSGRMALVCTNRFALRVLRGIAPSVDFSPVDTLEAALSEVRGVSLCEEACCRDTAASPRTRHRAEEAR
jgi:anti-sigma B factor antagonist